MRRLARLIPYLAVLFLVVVAVVALLWSGSVAGHLRIAIANELARQTGRPVRIGRVSLGPTGTVVLRDLEIENKDGSPFLKCPEATVWVGDVRSWLRGGSAPVEVKGIKLVGPEIRLVRLKEGQLDVADLVKARPKEKRFRGRLDVEQGRVTFVDMTRGGATTVLEQVALSLSSRETGETSFHLRATEPGGALASLELNGTSSDTGGTRISGSVSDLDLVYALDRLPKVKAFSVAAGRGDVEGEVTVGAGRTVQEKVRYRVEVSVTGAEVGFPWLHRPLKGVSGAVRLAEGELELTEVKASLAAAPVEVSGRIGNLADPQLALEIAASAIRVEQVEELFPNLHMPPALVVPVPMRLHARAEGLASKVVVTGKAEAQAVEFNQVPWHDAVADFRYSRGRLDITGLRAHGSARRLEANLAVIWGAGRSEGLGKVRLSQVPMAVLSQTLGLPKTELAGVATLEGQVRWAEGGPELSGAVTIEDASWRNLPLGVLRAEFTSRGRQVSLRNGSLKGPLGSAVFSGEISVGGKYAVEAQVSSVDLRALARALGFSWMSQFPFDLTGARLHISDKQIRASDVRLVGAGGEVSGNLEIGDWQNRAHGSLSGAFQVKGVALRSCLPGKWSGYVGEVSVDGAGQISGTGLRPQAKAALSLKAPVLSGVSLEVGQAQLRYQDEALWVDELTFWDGKNRARMTGSYRRDRGLDLEVVCDPIAVDTLTSKWRRRWGLSLQGTAKAEAHVAGPLDSPKVSFRASCDDLTVNDQKVDEILVVGDYEGETLHFEIAEAQRAQTRVTVWGDAGLPSGELDLNWQIANLDLFTVQAIAYSSAWRLDRSGAPVPHRELYEMLPRPLEGNLNAEGAVTGTLAQPKITAHLLLAPVSFAGRTVDTICGSVSASSQEVRIDLSAVHETAHASLTGYAQPGGDLSLSADVGNLNLALLEPWLQWGVDLGGEATINFVLSGTTAQPLLVGDVLVDNLVLGPLHFEAAEAVPIRLDSRGTLNVEAIRLRDKELEGSGSAVIPIRLPGRKNGAGDGLAATGELRVSNATFAAIPGMTPVAYDAALELAGNRILVRLHGDGGEPQPGIRGKAGSGTFSIGGDVRLPSFRPSDWAQGDLNLWGRLDHAEIEVAGLIAGELDGSFQLVNDQATRRPTLRTPPGEPLVLSQAEISVPVGQKRAPWRPGLPFAPDLRVRVVAGDNVWFRHGSRDRPTEIRIDPVRWESGSPLAEDGDHSAHPPAAGYLDVGGTLTASGVTLAGKAESHLGRLVFPNGTLTLRRGEATLQRDQGEKALRVNIGAEADGRVGDYFVSVNPEGQVYPPTSTSEATGGTVSAPFRWNARSLPYLDEAYVLTLLVGPVAAPIGGASQDLTDLLRGPGGASSPGEITGLMLPALGGALGVHEFTLDVGWKRPIRLRVGEKLFSRVMVSYVSALGDPNGSRTLRVDYEVSPRVAVGWSVDEAERTLWEVQSFVPF